MGLNTFDTGSLDSEGNNPESTRHTRSKLGETANLVVNTFASDTGSLDSEGGNLESIHCLGKPFTNDAPVASPADAQPSERLYKTLPSTLGLLALVVDAAPCDACAMSEGLLATVTHDDDTEFEEAATPYDQASLLGRAI